jgi:malate dehydrogenase (oxaloacetate-decarboxylating)
MATTPGNGSISELATTLPQTNSLTMRLEIQNDVGMIGVITSAIGEGGGNIGAIDLVEVRRDKVIRDITFSVWDEATGRAILKALRSIKGVKVVSFSDPVFLTHLGGKIAMHSRIPLKTRRDLSLAYTPGVGRVSMHIHQDPESLWYLTAKHNFVAVITDGTAVLGLGDIGPAASIPVMEGKSLLFKEFAGVDSWPIAIGTTDPDQFVETVKLISTGFGGINLEDISAPRCFYIEDRLKAELDIPVFHDDQHGTAVVVMAAVLNAVKLVQKNLGDLKVVVTGVGASGVACTKMLISHGVKNIIGCDRTGVVYKGRTENMNFMKEWFADNTNFDNIRGTVSDAIEGADLFLGLSGPGAITVNDIKKMNRDAIVFAMANPDPEIMPNEVGPYARIVATGRSDFPNQINNVLAFPGIFRGALDVQATEINEEMKMAAAYAIANTISKRELHDDYIVPSVFNRNVATAVAKAVSKAARDTGVALRRRSNAGWAGTNL